MRLKLKTLWQLRPRLLTVALVAIIGAMIVLANLTDEIERRGQDVFAAEGPFGPLRFSLRDAGPIDSSGSIHGCWSMSYGWPLLWRQYILMFWLGPSGVLGGCYSAARLAANLAIWFVTMAVPATACEWALRRRRRGVRWSLRAMLVGVGVAAAFCSWFVAARDRADNQDVVIAAEAGKQVWVKRWGPQWLDLVGADRYRRAIVGAKTDLTVYVEPDYQAKKELLVRLARLRDLQYFFLEVDEEPIPGLAEALRRMPRLRVLSILMDDGAGYYSGQRFSREGKRLAQECLEAIGAMTNLEHLSLSGMPITSEHLRCLAGLKKLKSLRLQVNHDAVAKATEVPVLSRLPPLPRLEAVDLSDCYVGDRGLSYLSVLPRLRRLCLSYTSMTEFSLDDLPSLSFDAGIADLAGIPSLEEVTIAGEMASATGLESLLTLKHLKKLHDEGPYLGRHATSALALDDGEEVTVLACEAERCRRALAALRRGAPTIVIDGGNDGKVSWFGEELVPAEYETIPDEMLRASALGSLEAWKKGARFQKAP